MNLIQLNFVYLSGLIYNFFILPCHPCLLFHFYAFFNCLFFFPILITIKKLKLTSSLLLLLTKSTEKNWNWGLVSLLGTISIWLPCPCAPNFLPPTILQHCTEKAVIDPQPDKSSYVDIRVNVQSHFIFSHIRYTKKKGLKLTLSPMCHVDNHNFFQGCQTFVTRTLLTRTFVTKTFVTKMFVTKMFVTILRTDVCDQELKFWNNHLYICFIHISMDNAHVCRSVFQLESEFWGFGR